MLNNRSQNVNKLLRGDSGHLPHASGTGTQGMKRMSITGLGEVSSEDFADALDGALGSIAALRRNIDNFDPTGTGSEDVGSPSYTRRNSGGLSREDLREQRERIEAYKMTRKVEPELPPLQRSPPKPPRQAPATDILLRNASPEALRSVSLQSKMEQMTQNMTLKDQRTATAAALRQGAVNQKTEVTLEKLEQKAQQGARAAAMRRSNQPKSMQDARDFRKDQMLEKWMAACLAGSFARQVLEEVKVRRMTDKERMEYLQNTEELGRMRKNNSTGFLQQAVQQAESIKEIESKPELVRKLGDVATRVQYMLRRHRIRQDAKVVVACLKEWRVAGRTFVHLKHFAQRVVKMQQWWRRMSAQLEEVRERVSKRWERLEQAQISRELAKAAPPPPEKSRRTLAKNMIGGLTIEDRVKNAMLPEEVRLRFLRHELRARRYALLPEIACWEEDLSNWRKDMQQWQEQCEAHRALGLSGTVVNAPLLKWPPVRPSHLPKGHLPEEELRGCECPPWCPGRKGDEEILDMYRRCKQSRGEGGWMKVEVAKNSKGTSKKSKSFSAPKGPAGSSAGGVADLTVGMEVVVGGDDEPDVEEEELRKWGVSADRLPGASKVPPDRGNRA